MIYKFDPTKRPEKKIIEKTVYVVSESEGSDIQRFTSEHEALSFIAKSETPDTLEYREEKRSISV